MNEDIAIIGIATKVPYSNSLDEFWENLLLGENCISDTINNEETSEIKENYIFKKGLISSPEKFDRDFFKFRKEDAEKLDPQFRLMLESVYHALEDSGYANRRKKVDIGVFLSSTGMDSYSQHVLFNNQDPSSFTADGFLKSIYSKQDFLSTIVSYKLGLTGPSLSIQTACSSSLVSVIVACQNLLLHDTDIAIAGGVCIRHPIRTGYQYIPGMMLSASGEVSTFNKNANGIVLGDGLGVVVLKRFSEAVKDGDNIYCKIKGYAYNNDGNEHKMGYTAPSVLGQSYVIKKALKSANISPDDVGYIEAHGTGTVLGDRLELAAIKEVFFNKKNRGYIGSVKPNIGHLDTASGVVNLIKATQIVKTGIIPPVINVNKFNQHNLLHEIPFSIPENITEFKAESNRCAGVSSFGIGGTNSHIILEEYKPLSNNDRHKKKQYFIPISARNNRDLVSFKDELFKYLSINCDLLIEDIEYSLHMRDSFDKRILILCKNISDLIDQLKNKKIKTHSALSHKQYIDWLENKTDTIQINRSNQKIISLPLYQYFGDEYKYVNRNKSEFKNFTPYSSQKKPKNYVVSTIVKFLIEYIEEDISTASYDVLLIELGLDSISSFSLAYDISKEFNIEIPFIIDSTKLTINTLSQAIDKLIKETRKNGL